MNPKILFDKDIAETLERTRQDERSKCDTEKVKALQQLRTQLENEFTLKIKEMESQVKSMEFRLKNIDEREKKISSDRQEVREDKITLRRIASDLAHIGEQVQKENIEWSQKFTALLQDTESIERKMLKEK